MAKKIKEPTTIEEFEKMMEEESKAFAKKIKDGLQDPPYTLSPESLEMLKKQMGDDWVEEDEWEE